MQKINIKETNVAFALFMLGYMGMAMAIGRFLPETCPQWLVMLINEFIIILPIALMLTYKKTGLMNVLRFEKISLRDILVTYIGAYTLLPIIMFLNMLTMLFANNYVTGMVLDIYSYPLWLQLLLMAVMPAFVEEFVFRGCFYGSYRRRNVIGGALMSGLFFGLMHMNINQFAYAFVIGVMFCLLYEATGNFFIPVVAHFAINANTIITLAFSGTGEQDLSNAAGVDVFAQTPMPVMVIILGMMLAIGMVGLLIFNWLLSKLAKWHGREGFIRAEIGKVNEDVEGRFCDIVFLISVILLVVCMVVMELE